MKKMLFLSLLLLASFATNAQVRNCAAMDVLDRLQQEDPTIQQRMNAIEQHTQRFIAEGGNQGQRVVVTIPVVFHIVWRTNFPSENISDAQIQTQLNVLNLDYRRLNTDANLVPADFAGVAADCEIQFCLAQRTPAGAATTGIVRYQSGRTSDWGTNDAVKLPAQGGVAPWDASKYLNVWVCSIGGGILGYAQFPGGSASTDGVVNDYRYFGTNGTATAPFNRGRTMTHEVGHWLNLRHIWGDANCGSDLVNDTPTHNTANYGCPAQPHFSTCTGQPREQTMNYMDYSDDACMYMFSAGQKSRMQAVLAAGGARASLATSNGCQAPAGGGTCGAPSGLNATSVTQTGATLNWGAVAGATAYNVQWRVNGAATWTTIANVAGTSRALTGLTANTTYNFQVQSICGATTSAYASPVNFTTTGTCTDTYEANETRATSKSIAVNTNITARIGTATDRDYFVFVTTAAAPKIKIDLTNLPADYDIRFYNANGTQLAISQNGGTTSEQIIYNTPTGGATYFVQVFGYNGAFNANSCYNLRISTQAGNWRTADAESEAGVLEIGQEVGEDNFSFNVMPNPVLDQASVVFAVQQDQEVRISVIDLTGREVMVQQTLATKSGQLPLDLSALPRGLYFIRMENGRSQFTQKVIVE